MIRNAQRWAAVFGILLFTVVWADRAATADDFAKGVPSEAALKTKMALKLAGLVTFVASSCPDLQVEFPRFKGAVEALGVTYADLENQDNKAAYLSYALRYKEDADKNCARARSDFGPNGKTVPDIFKAKVAN